MRQDESPRIKDGAMLSRDKESQASILAGRNLNMGSSVLRDGLASS